MRTADGRAGFSLMEMLIVLAIMALAAVIVVPRGEALLDGMTAHAVYFDFQRQMLDLRRQAYADQAGVVVRGADGGVAGEGERVIPLRAGWSYTLERPMAISSGGVCDAVRVVVLKSGRPAMRLAPTDAACHFIRLD